MKQANLMHRIIRLLQMDPATIRRVARSKKATQDALLVTLIVAVLVSLLFALALHSADDYACHDYYYYHYYYHAHIRPSFAHLFIQRTVSMFLFLFLSSLIFWAVSRLFFNGREEYPCWLRVFGHMMVLDVISMFLALLLIIGFIDTEVFWDLWDLLRLTLTIYVIVFLIKACPLIHQR